jgi:nuclear receptor-binding protein
MFWTDVQVDKARVIFITEYMTSGSLKQFLKKTRKNDYKTLNEKVSSIIILLVPLKGALG